MNRSFLLAIQAAILVLAIVFATLSRPSSSLAIAVFAVTISILYAAIVLAASRTGSRRAFWAVFALCGWTYLYLAHHEIYSLFLVTGIPLQVLWLQFVVDRLREAPVFVKVDAADFFMIGHCLFLLLFSFSMASLTARLHKRNHPTV